MTAMLESEASAIYEESIIYDCSTLTISTDTSTPVSRRFVYPFSVVGVLTVLTFCCSCIYIAILLNARAHPNVRVHDDNAPGRVISDARVMQISDSGVSKYAIVCLVVYAILIAVGGATYFDAVREKSGVDVS